MCDGHCSMFWILNYCLIVFLSFPGSQWNLLVVLFMCRHRRWTWIMKLALSNAQVRFSFLCLFFCFVLGFFKILCILFFETPLSSLDCGRYLCVRAFVKVCMWWIFSLYAWALRLSFCSMKHYELCNRWHQLGHRQRCSLQNHFTHWKPSGSSVTFSWQCRGHPSTLLVLTGCKDVR